MSDNPKSVKEAPVEESENAETEGPSLIQTIYASRASEAFVEGELAGLMEQSRSNNLRGELTGMLLYCEGSFFQVLEGEEEAVRSVYRSIEKDPRHEDMVKIIEEEIEERAFGDWSMGLMTATRKQIEEGVEGFNDYFQEGTCLTDVDPGRGRKLLRAFASGQWRVS